LKYWGINDIMYTERDRMQQIHCRYRRDISTAQTTLSEIKQILLDAANRAGIEIDSSKRGLLLGSPLAVGAASDDERCIFSLTTPEDPGEIRRKLSLELPQGLQIINCWQVNSGTADADLAVFDESVYTIMLQNPPSGGEIISLIRNFIAQKSIIFTRKRENKTQQLDARRLVKYVRLISADKNCAELEMVFRISNDGVIRPDEALTVMNIPADNITVHRIAMRASHWRRPTPSSALGWWRRRLTRG
jgi:radical SAM-linked protein